MALKSVIEQIKMLCLSNKEEITVNRSFVPKEQEILKYLNILYFIDIFFLIHSASSYCADTKQMAPQA